MNRELKKVLLLFHRISRVVANLHGFCVATLKRTLFCKNLLKSVKIILINVEQIEKNTTNKDLIFGSFVDFSEEGLSDIL